MEEASELSEKTRGGRISLDVIGRVGVRLLTFILTSVDIQLQACVSETLQHLADQIISTAYSLLSWSWSILKEKISTMNCWNTVPALRALTVDLDELADTADTGNRPLTL